MGDCSRVITALRALWGGESVAGTRSVLEEAFTTWGRPAAIGSDNAAAFNTSRTAGPGATEKWLASQGIRPISGRVGHPQTQGKVERSHQPAATWLRAHPASTLAELNTELDHFTSYYNTERQHQGHGAALTPLRVWTQTPRALASPAPIDLERLPAGGGPISLPDPTGPAGSDSAVDRARRTVMSNGTVSYKNRALSLGKPMSGTEVTLIEYPTRLDIYDHHQRRVVSLPWPQPTQRQQGNRATIDTRKLPYRLIPQPPRRRRTSHKS
ncbi:transposase [Actinomyces viscosus]|nr:transposase [Actinomyces viscosus]